MLRIEQDELFVNENTLVIGIDVAKDFHVAMSGCKREGVERRKRINNTHVGFKSLGWYIERQRNRWDCEKVVVSMESSGHYWEPLGYWLVNKGYAVAWVNTLHTKMYSEISDNSPQQDDTKAARVIVELTLQNKHLNNNLPMDTGADLRCQTASYDHLKRQDVRIVNRLHRLVDRVFPELPKLWSDAFKASSFLALLAKAPTPRRVLALGKPGLATLLRRTSRGQLGSERAEEILEAARYSVGVAEGSEGLLIELACQLKLLKTVRDGVEELELAMAETLESHPEAEILLDVPELATLSVAQIIGHVGDFDRYRSTDQLMKLAGLNLFYRNSGKTKRSKKKIARRGRAGLRETLYLASVRLRTKGDAPLKPYYERVLGKCGEKQKAQLACTRRLWRFLCGAVRSGTDFDPDRLRPQDEEAIEVPD